MFYEKPFIEIRVYRISVQQEGKAQMSEETNVMKVDSEKIKEVLRHHNELTQQLHYQIIDIQKKIEEVKKQSIEVAAYPHIDFSARGKGGVKKDLADVYLKYQKMIRNREKELTAEILILTADAEGIHRLYLCFRSLTGEGYNIIYRLYVKGDLYRQVEEEMGLNHRIFEEKRKQAIEEIQRLYESDLTNAQIVRMRRNNITNERKKKEKKDEYEQITLSDIGL